MERRAAALQTGAIAWMARPLRGPPAPEVPSAAPAAAAGLAGTSQTLLHPSPFEGPPAVPPASASDAALLLGPGAEPDPDPQPEPQPQPDLAEMRPELSAAQAERQRQRIQAFSQEGAWFMGDDETEKPVRTRGHPSPDCLHAQANTLAHALSARPPSCLQGTTPATARRPRRRRHCCWICCALPCWRQVSLTRAAFATFAGPAATCRVAP